VARRLKEVVQTHIISLEDVGMKPLNQSTSEESLPLGEYEEACTIKDTFQST
jgi:hypothetical protein